MYHAQIGSDTELVIWPRSILLLQRGEIEAATQYTPALIYEGHLKLSRSCAVWALARFVHALRIEPL